MRRRRRVVPCCGGRSRGVGGYGRVRGAEPPPDSRERRDYDGDMTVEPSKRSRWRFASSAAAPRTCVALLLSTSPGIPRDCMTAAHMRIATSWGPCSSSLGIRSSSSGAATKPSGQPPGGAVTSESCTIGRPNASTWFMYSSVSMKGMVRQTLSRWALMKNGPVTSARPASVRCRAIIVTNRVTSRFRFKTRAELRSHSPRSLANLSPCVYVVQSPRSPNEPSGYMSGA